MHTHTIRHKSRPTSILTFTPQFFKELLATDMDTVTLVLAKFKSDYKRLTGSTISLEYEQEIQLYKTLLNTEHTNTMWTSKYACLPKTAYKIHNLFVDGLINSPIITMDESLPLITEFFNMLDQTYAHILAQRTLLDNDTIQV